ncbi:unnamed protein product [Ectocarpus sp. 12 AP-2014]
MSSPPDPPAALVGQYGLPAGLSAEEAGLYVDGLTHTCAALRRRIAELESVNRALQQRTSNLDTAAGESSGGYAGGLFGGADSTLSPTDMMVLMSPPGVAAERIGGGVPRGKDSCSKSGSGPRARLSWMAGRPGRGSTAPRELEAGGLTIAAAQGFDDSATRRVSAIPSRARYPVGPSRFSLPPNMSPGPANASTDGTKNDSENGPEISPRHRWEGLTLTHPLTGDEKNLTFMEFAIVGVSLSTLAGTQPLGPWGQAPEVLSGFPVTEGDDASGRGKGDGSFVQGLGEFCFPRGANIALVRGRGGTGTREAAPEDRMHLLQFTDCDNASTYGCCLTVTHVLQDPSPRLVQRLQERERMHQAARTLQKFFTLSAACLSTGEGHHWRGDSTGHGCATPTRTPGEEGGSFSRFGFQTPPPRAAAGGGLTGAGSAASEQGNSPASSFSGMINRFFSNPGMVADGGSGVAAAAGGLSIGASAADAETASSGVAAVGAAVADGGGTRPGDDSDNSPPRSVRGERTSPRKKRSVAAVAVSPSRPRPPAPPPPPAALSPSRLRQRAPSSPCPRTSPSGEYCHDPKGIGGRSRSAGHDGGGGGNVAGREWSDGTVKKNVPGVFSDDESESDAGYSSTDGGDSLGGRSFEAASFSGSQAANGTRRGGQSGGVRGYAKGSCPEMPGAERSSGTPMTPRTPPGVTLRNRTVNPRTVAAVIGGATKGREASAGRGRLSWSVQVEKSYVMVSSHRNHPLMFKVLKAIADAERSARPGSSPPSSSLSPPAHHTAAGGRRRAVIASLSPPRVRSGGVVGVNRKGGGKEKSPSASRFRSVAAAAAEQAKERHRRMVRDKFLQQVRTDKSCIEEGKKVSLYCPAFLRAPLELTPPSLELWSTAVLFGCVSEQTILRAVDVLLLEKTLVVCGRDIGIVSMAATALLSLLDPFKWEGVFVPVVPVALMDVLGSPVPALVGVQAPLDPLSYAADGVAVLDLDANNASGELFMAGAHEDSTVPEHLVTSLEHANTLRGRRRSSGAPAGRRSPARKLDALAGGRRPKHKESSSHDRVATSTGGSGSGPRGVFPRGTRGGVPLSELRSSSSSSLSSSSPGPRSHLVFQASTFMAGLTLEEKGVVLRLRSLVKAHVSRLCGDLVASDMWRKYGAFNSVTNNFDFHPDWFTEPLEAQLRFQVAVSRTQMFVSFVERCRQKDISEVGDEVEEHEQLTPEKRPPYAESGTGGRRGSRGSILTH